MFKIYSTGYCAVANDPALKFNDITKLLGELIAELQDQYVKLRKLQDKHGKTLKDGFIRRNLNEQKLWY